MSRTVHHIVYKRRDSTVERNREYEELIASGGNCWMSYRRPYTARERHTIVSLRYSAAAVAEAERAGRRPIPQQKRHRLEAYTYPRTYNIGHVITGLSNRQERALRAADRAADRKAVQMLRAAHNAVEAAWDVEFADPRHRHYGVWDSY